jgi:3-oxoadipate enol-lactonase
MRTGGVQWLREGVLADARCGRNWIREGLSMPVADVGTIEHNGCRLHYRISGPASAPLVVFIHGARLDRRSFALQARVLSRYYRVLEWDLRGHGHSQPMGAPLTAASATDDLCVLLDHVGSTAAALVGHSFGAMVAQELAFRAPQRVAALVACGSPCITLPTTAVLRTARRLAPPLIGLLRMLPYDQVRARMARLMAIDPEVQALAREMIGTVEAKHYVTVVRALVAASHGEPGYRYGGPLLLLYGAQDPFIVGGRVIRAWQARDQQARVLEVPGAGHLVMLDAPQVTTAAMLGFLCEVLPPR